MIVQTCVGSIRPEAILSNGSVSWALQWLQRAKDAESQGNELIVFEIPKTEISIDQGVVSELVMPPDGH